MSIGTVDSIKDLVIRVQFDEEWPRVGEILIIQNEQSTKLLVDHLEPGGLAMCLNLAADRRVQRGMEVKGTGKGIEIPVGEITIGRILDAIGDCIDGKPNIEGADVAYRDIFKLPGKATIFTISDQEMLEPRLQVSEL